jgi:hypothetical protein
MHFFVAFARALLKTKKKYENLQVSQTPTSSSSTLIRSLELENVYLQSALFERNEHYKKNHANCILIVLESN